MGNYSYLIEQVGCEIDFKKLKTDYLNKEDIKGLRKWGLGQFIDGWKIQGYWYKSFCKFLNACARAMKGLTESKWDNFLEMEEEQGYRFWIHFLIDNGKPTVIVDYVPMETQSFKIDDEGNQVC